MQLVIRPNANAAAELVAQHIAGQLKANPRLVLGLATGRTMDSVYARLVWLYEQGSTDFSNCRAFNLDEYVGLTESDPNSYRYYMNKHLFTKVNIELCNTHLPNGIAKDLKAECERYEKLIASEGGIDVQLLGIGRSGHLGFNEPLSALRSRTHVTSLTAATIEQNAGFFGGPEKMPRRAITMGLGTILEAKMCILLATGEEKAEILAKAVEGPLTGMVPASTLQLHPHCTIVVDEAAASGFSEATRSLVQSSSGLPTSVSV